MFAKLGSDYIINGTTSLENLYVSEYLPTLPDVINKVYIYGLYLSTQAPESDNSLGGMAARLGLTEQDIEDAYKYLAGLGLVQILATSPTEVRYLPVKLATGVKKYKPAKYADFNTRLQEIISGRVLTPNEFTQYYDFLEYTKMEQEALLLVAKYATTLKDTKIGYSYVLTIARNWNAEGVKTAEQVEAKLLESDSVSTALSDIAKALGIKKSCGFEERQLYLKWTNGMEYDLETLVAVAKTCKKGGMARLDAKMTRYYAAKLFTLSEIRAYEENTERLYRLARSVTKKLGLYYEQLDNIVDSYITVWLNLGFDEDALTQLADMCFKRGVRTLEEFDRQMHEFYKQGIITSSAINNHVLTLENLDGKIAEILAAAKSTTTTIRSRDRDLYRTWTYAWSMPHDLILYGATLAAGTAQPLPYLNKILADWRSKGIETADAAKALKHASPASQQAQSFKTRDYSQSQINALFDDINEDKF